MDSDFENFTDDSSSDDNINESNSAIFNSGIIDDSFSSDTAETAITKPVLKKPSNGLQFIPDNNSTFITKVSSVSEQSQHSPDNKDDSLSRASTTLLVTPRSVSYITPSRSPSPSSDDDILSISSDGDDDDDTTASFKDNSMNLTKMKQTTLKEMFLKGQKNAMEESVDILNIEVSQVQYQEQKEKVQALREQLQKAKNTLRIINLDGLPDKGKILIEKDKYLNDLLKNEEELLNKMTVSKNEKLADKSNNIAEKKITAWTDPKNLITWEDLEAGVQAVKPKTFGKQALATYNAQKALTVDRLEQLHGSLENCPKEDHLETDPKGLKVELMQHQRRALAWLLWREKQKPSGGILADDMGLGKTLTMISLILKSREIKKEDAESSSDEENRVEKKKSKYKGGTLVVCPASLLSQWESEIQRRCKRGLLSVELYHGSKRETKPKMLAEHDVVISTYTIMLNECERNGAPFRIRWERIILDEAHQIRNHKALSSVAVCQLSAKSRWILTGTPVHNKALDMYALFKFLRCSPFDDLAVWKRWVGDKSTGGQERLYAVISSLMLRRTKPELIERGLLTCMTERNWEIIPITLDKNELGVYQKILIFSRTLFSQFLHQRAEKQQDVIDYDYGGLPNNPNSEYYKMREKLLKLNKVKNIKQHEILVLLLRLRQICCHPCLIKQMLEKGEDLGDGADEDESEEFNLLEQLNKLDLNAEDDYNQQPIAAGVSNAESVGLSEASRGLLNPSNPVFSKRHRSSKIKMALNVIKEKIMSKNDKAVVVSQWTSFLGLIGKHLREEEIEFLQLDGTVPVTKRMDIIENFNNPKHQVKILLLSLTAGGVGLNLIGGNHLLLLDLHWNPQLENQAQDRIYRVGQTKPVHIYKLVACDTVEERIKKIQESKLNIADAMLTGSKQVISNKLTLNDLKMLFAV